MKTAITIIAFGLLLGFNAVPAQAQGYSVGDKAMDFKLPSVDGSQVSLADYADAKGFIVVFTCNTCPFAQAYESRIMALNDRFAGEGFPVIAINPNNPELQPGDSFEKMKQRAEAKGYSFPYLLDQGQEVFPAYGATRTPHVFLLEKSGGDYLVRYIGAIDDNHQDPSSVETPYVTRAVEAILNGEEVPVKNTRAIGCSIKA